MSFMHDRLPLIETTPLVPCPDGVNFVNNYTPLPFGIVPTAIPPQCLPVFSPRPHQPKIEVGYDTNSKMPALSRARVFVGNLHPDISRDHLINLFSNCGRVLALNLVKSKNYAFVQFSNQFEALAAVTFINSMILHGKAMHVEFATNSIENGDLVSPTLGGKRKAADSISLANKKRLHVSIEEQQTINSKAVIEDKTKPNELFAQDSVPLKDTMICGICHAVFHDWIKFRDHRRKPCSYKDPSEPPLLYCTWCQNEFNNGWFLIQHIQQKHQVIYQLEKNQGEKEF